MSARRAPELLGPGTPCGPRLVLVPLVRVLAECRGDAGGFVHWGVT
jgi:hypothetical protein